MLSSSLRSGHRSEGYSNVSRGKRRKPQGEGPTPLGESIDISASVATRAWARRIKQVDEEHPFVCPCGPGPLRLLAVIAQPAVLEQILRHLGLWLRQAHSPPAGYPVPFSWHRVVAADSASLPR